MITVAVLALLLAGSVLAPAQVERATIEEVLDQVEGIRGLRADPGVPVDYLNQDQLRQRMISDFEEENPEEEIRTASEIMVMLGFMEPDLDLYKLYIDLYTEQVAGFYDPEEKRLFLISEEQGMSAMDRYILAHELTHYLQDSNFDLMRPPFHDPEDAAEETDDDAAFAATCLVEGDAMITSESWLSRYFDLSDLREMQQESGEFSTDVLDSAPEYIRDALMFPYEEGLAFVRYIHRKGGYAAVDRAFREPPDSTEQIYHPQKYLDGEKPVPVDLADMSGSLGAGWEQAYDNVLGEFDYYELFKPYMDEDEAAEAAAGWGGNKYHYYRNGSGERLLVQGCAWDSAADAEEFIAAFVRYLDGRFGKELAKGEARGAWATWSAGEYMLALKKDGTRVYLLQATGEGPLQAAIVALGEGGDEIGDGLLEKTKGEEKKETERDIGWIVIAGVAALFVVGIALIVVMFVLLRRPPAPPGTPPYGGYGGYGGPGGYGPGGYGVYGGYGMSGTGRQGGPYGPGYGPHVYPPRFAVPYVPGPPSPPAPGEVTPGGGPDAPPGSAPTVQPGEPPPEPPEPPEPPGQRPLHE